VFITLEGPEGAGKSTLRPPLAARLRAEGHEVVETREPGSGGLGAGIRHLLLNGEAMTPTAELFLFLADRAQHVADIIRPALNRGAWVLCDRHADSTVVYQGHARGLDVSLMRQLNAVATEGLRPNLILLLDLDPAIGLARQDAARRDRLDAEPITFHQRVRQGFLTEARREPKRWSVLDASASTDSVLAAALAAIHGVNE